MLRVQAKNLSETFSSYDNAYNMYVSVKENAQTSVNYIDITIYDSITEQEVFCSSNEYRAFDFQWVTWENQTNNFWLKSGDLGTFYYEYQGNNTWEKYNLYKEDDQYFLIKGYGKSQEKKMVKIEDIQ